MKRCLVLLLIFLSSGCANMGPSNPSGEPPTAYQQSAKIHTELGAGYLQQRQIAIALDEFNEAVKYDPNYALAYNGLGLVYSALGEISKADDNFKKSIVLDPSNSQSRNNYGSFLCSQNKIDESIVQFMEAVKNPLYTSASIAYTNAGSCALRKKDTAGAESFFTKALQIDPLLNQAAYPLALIQFNRGDFTTAYQTLQTALVNEPSPEILWLGIRIARKLGNGDAEASFAVELKGKYPDSAPAKALLSGQ